MKKITRSRRDDARSRIRRKSNKQGIARKSSVPLIFLIPFCPPPPLEDSFWGIYLNANTKSLHLSSTHLHLSKNYLTERNRKDRLGIPQFKQQTQYLFPPLNW